MSEKFSLKWNDFQSKWNSSLSEMRKDTNFADVTLISEDKVKFCAHKILLSSCSNIFKFILKENTCEIPLLYLGGVSSQNIGFILDYIYFGEVSIYQEHLDSFLESARKLQISGLIGGSQDKNHTAEHSVNQANVNRPFKKEQEPISDDTSSSMVTTSDTDGVKPRRQCSKAPRNDDSRIDVANMTPEEIEEKTKELYQKIDGVWTCLQCGKTSGQDRSSNIRYHVEIHLDGLCYTCKICCNEFRSKKSFRNHKAKYHK